ncbi:MAG: hypothetical protein QOF76_1205 [Solirubrobacteraceae bacterium]|jgi:hypothetical protein|nr:hypothetical protein [Solirubrobacteraceae bacterium]
MKGVPSDGELLAAVREFLQQEVMPATDGRRQFLTRVAMNVLAQVERELELGPECARRHAERLQALGVADDAALVGAIRDGTLEDRTDDVVAAIRAGVVDRLRIANPRWLLPEDQNP